MPRSEGRCPSIRRTMAVAGRASRARNHQPYPVVDGAPWRGGCRDAGRVHLRQRPLQRWRNHCSHREALALMQHRDHAFAFRGARRLPLATAPARSPVSFCLHAAWVFPEVGRNSPARRRFESAAGPAEVRSADPGPMLAIRSDRGALYGSLSFWACALPLVSGRAQSRLSALQ